MHDSKDILRGIVERIVFHNEENGFSIFRLHCGSQKLETVTGHTPHIRPGESVILQGSWIMHPKFGRQFQADQCSAEPPSTAQGMEKYLASGLIKGIGPVYAKKMVKKFGTQVLEIIDKNPEQLKTIDGIGQKRYAVIIAAWADQKEISHIMVFLQDRGISTTYATKIYKKYGARSLQVVQENPYRLADDIWGIGFKTADSIAQSMGFSHESPYRIQSGILFALKAANNDGHLYAEIQALKISTIKLLELDTQTTQEKIKHALHELYNAEKIKLISHNNLHYITLPQFYFSEKSVAEKIKKLISYPFARQLDLTKIYTKLRTPQKNDAILLNEDQQKSVMGALQEKVSIITGGPGTGKTTVIKKILSIFDEEKIIYQLAAPTGRAAKRMTESTGKPAQTAHRLLEFDVSIMNFSKNEQNALKLDVLIVDEASMIDIFLAHAILKALPLHAQILFIGDIDQLPSVGAGNFLSDLIASNKVTTLRLQEIFRQAQDSLIITNAHRVNNGEFPQSFKENSKRDFIFIKEDDPETMPQHLEHIYKNGLKKFGISHHHTTVLVPMNRGGVGTQKLNYDLQKLLNPHNTEHTATYAGTQFKIGDRVLQTRNNYDKLIFNGDIGVIKEIIPTDSLLRINFYERILDYEYSELDELTHAYAITIHKSQGSEYDAIIIPIFMQHFTLLQRNLLYTAITRAKKLCILIGQTKAIGMAVRNTQGKVRMTFLKEFLTSDLSAR